MSQMLVEPFSRLVYDAIVSVQRGISMKKWEPIRESIDKVDEKLIKLLNKRAVYAQKIAKAKRESGDPVFLPARENKILKRVKELNKGPLSSEALQGVYREIFSATRSVELAIKVASLGPAGSFSHLAALRLFGSSCEHVLTAGIDAVFYEVEKGRAHYGVVPIENTIEGTVGITQDFLMESGLKIFGELYFDIHQNLLSKANSISQIKTLHTSGMPLKQCRSWVGANLPDVKIVEAVSSSEAALKASKEKDSAAIGAAPAAKIYGLGVLAENIEQAPGNQTRFLVISRESAPKSGNDKTSIMFSIKDKAGALSEILRLFAGKNINLSKIQSRPRSGAAWEYIFFVDFDGHMEEKNTRQVLKKLEEFTLTLKTLGSYPNAKA